MSRPIRPTVATPGRSGIVAVVSVAGVLVVLLAVWAAVVGPDDPLRGDGIRPDRASVTTPSETPTELGGASGEEVERERREPSRVLPILVGTVMALTALALAAAALWLLVVWLRGLRLGRAPAEEETGDTPLDPVVALRRLLAADAAQQEGALLADGDPRNAVVACWQRFEQTAERAGVPRQPAETSTEFTVRLLGLVAADPAAVARLSGLYREARFSTHPVGEGTRDEALGLVRALHRDLRSPLGEARR